MTKPQARILVVDDERNIRKNFSIVLEAAGYEVDTAGDGEEALTKSKEQSLRYRLCRPADAEDGGT